MATNAPRMKAQEFDAFVKLPENANRRLELIGGEVVEVLPDENSRRITVNIARLIKAYLDQLPIGHATPPGIGYVVGDDRYMPDIGFISNTRQPNRSTSPYNALAPDLAFVIVLPPDDIANVVAKVMNYQLAGAVVWVSYPKSKEIQVNVPGQPTRKLGIDDTLEGGGILPGFTAKLQDIFAGE